MNHHFKKWSHNYRHYIDPWYGKLTILFIERGFKPPTKHEFYTHCYLNSSKYYNEDENKKVPPIILTPLFEEEMISNEQ